MCFYTCLKIHYNTMLMQIKLTALQAFADNFVQHDCFAVYLDNILIYCYSSQRYKQGKTLPDIQ